ncbi:CNNM domain-containing protein [Brevibacterium album]|uniref:CNNM domain-containing protein n=1 Tax=Brevibacterium album TaxID=417948 RepID=UPI00040D813E|nr:hemolysin family protein [Brevibacterium album]
MTDSPAYVIVSTIVLIGLSAFFVVIEFALLAARPHRLEEQAATRRGARAALRGMNELTLMLAVAQFGITICTFALGAVTKPAVDAWLGPVFGAWGAPLWLADTGAFLLSLLFVTFLHLVVGEMAPKSWAIAHPEFAAGIIGVPARMLAWCLRPLLVWVNRVANRLVAASGHTPAESRAQGGQDVDAIRKLVEHSAATGVLDDTFRAQLAQVFDLERLRVADLLPSGPGRPTAVPETATAGDLRREAARTGHLRILVERRDSPPGMVHVRDVLLAPADAGIREHVREPRTLDAATPVYEALSSLREAGEQFAVVTRDGDFAGVVTMSDVLRQLLPNGAGLRL